MPPFVDDIVVCPNEVRLIRILRNESFWTPKDVPTRASSGAFFDGLKENSCFMLHHLTPEHFKKIEDKYSKSKLAVITAADARACGYTVCDDPSDFLPGHVVVCPPKDIKSNAYRRMADRLANLSAIFQQPEPTL
ncbi:MAG TPA: hypothetical protein VG649_00090 [Candidatus Angelobacter sp.]|jgi:hypothetical protein|nr:hypothetical protein [Candidatus Angelobacter sp.]